MNAVLTNKERDKAVYALREIGRELFGDPRRLEFADLDLVQTHLAGWNLQIAPIPKPQGLTPADLAPAGAPTAAPVPTPISAGDLRWLETAIIAMYHANKSNNVNGYVLKNEVLGKVLSVLCPPLGISFKL